MSYTDNDLHSALEHLDAAQDYFNGVGDIDEDTKSRFQRAIREAEQAVEDAQEDSKEKILEVVGEDLGTAIGAGPSEFYLPDWVDDNTLEVTHVGTGARVIVSYEIEEE